MNRFCEHYNEDGSYLDKDYVSLVENMTKLIPTLKWFHDTDALHEHLRFYGNEEMDENSEEMIIVYDDCFELDKRFDIFLDEKTKRAIIALLNDYVENSDTID